MRDCVKEYVFSSHSWPKQITVRRRRTGLNRIGCSVDDVDLGFKNQQVLPPTPSVRTLTTITYSAWVCLQYTPLNLVDREDWVVTEGGEVAQREDVGQVRILRRKGCRTEDMRTCFGLRKDSYLPLCLFFGAGFVILPYLLTQPFPKYTQSKYTVFHDVTSCDNKG